MLEHVLHSVRVHAVNDLQTLLLANISFIRSQLSESCLDEASFHIRSKTLPHVIDLHFPELND